DPFYVVRTVRVQEKREDTVEVKALLRHVNEQFESYVKLNRKVPQETLLSIMNLEDPSKQADNIAAHLSIKVADKQKLLAAASPSSRLKQLSSILNDELEILEMEQKIRGEARRQNLKFIIENR